MKTGRHGGGMMWAALAACALVMLGAMTWLTREVLASERQRTEAEARAEQEQRVRLALWRMDALGANMLLTFNQQTADTFRQADPFQCSQHNAVLQFDLTDRNKLAIRGGLQNQEKAQGELRQLLTRVSKGGAYFSELEGLLPAGTSTVWGSTPPPINQEEPQAGPIVPVEIRDGNGGIQSNEKPKAEQVAAPKQQMKQVAKQEAAKQEDTKQADTKQGYAQNDYGNNQQYALSKEASLRQKAVVENWDNLQQISRANASNAFNDANAAWVTGTAELFHAKWLEGRLFLLRRVQWKSSRSDDNMSIQGVWLDADALRARLLEEVSDLLPNARLEIADRTSLDALTLASLPWTLQAGSIELAPVRNAVAGSLLLGWLTAIAAIAVAAVLVRGVMRLSERRASFVSAVTHELRTPLTTFRLYSDMLESGAVKEERRGEYFRTLRREADRLAHLVENVLAFSRIERGSARATVQATTPGSLLESMRERFEARLASAGLALQVEIPQAVAAQPLQVDAAGVEHVLFNLIDNAAKYAAAGTDKRVVLSSARRNGWLTICVRDFGPGISPGERRKIFRPFHKSAQAAAESQPGVGLGLALSQRLAQELGGRLTHEAPQGCGAVFCLELPVA